ncbi:MAG: hypothetical protein GW925_01455 [Candidatus Pacebacteria bacterium]|nr:hypothetical protein [Candidatus Paceibacterota bacterium]
MKKTKPKTVSIDEITDDFTDEDWKAVKNEKRFYKLANLLRNRRLKMRG